MKRLRLGGEAMRERKPGTVREKIAPGGVLVVLIGLAACGGATEDGGRTAYRDTETVVATLPGHEATRFGGRAGINFSQDIELRTETVGVWVIVHDAASTTAASVNGTIELAQARALFAGEVVDVRNPMSPIAYAGPGTERPPAAPELYGTVVAMQISLDESAASSTLRFRLADDREIVVRGQIGIGCTIQDAEGEKSDPRWESPFCAEQRASMNVEPFLAAMR